MNSKLQVTGNDLWVRSKLTGSKEWSEIKYLGYFAQIQKCLVMKMTSDIVDMWAGSEVSSNGNDFRHCGYMGRFRSA